MANDLTVIFYSSNQKPEPFAAKIRAVIREAVGDRPLLSITHKPTDLGVNVVWDRYPPSTYGLYRQILTGAVLAETRFVAMAEDDCLMTAEHYDFIPPTDDTFYYNRSRWWIELYDKRPRYRWRKRTVMSTCVCNRELLIEWCENLFRKFPEYVDRQHAVGFAEPGRYEGYLGLPKVKLDFFRTIHAPIVTFNTKPSLGGIRSSNDSDLITDYLEPWGSAAKIWEKYVGDWQ